MQLYKDMRFERKFMEKIAWQMDTISLCPIDTNALAMVFVYNIFVN